MELSSKSRTIKKKNKKKLNHANGLVPSVKPDKFDGASNWAKMQEVLGIAPSHSKKPNRKSSGGNFKSRDHRSSSSYRDGLQLGDFLHSSLIPEKAHGCQSSSTQYSDILKTPVRSHVTKNSYQEKGSSSKSFKIYSDSAKASESQESKEHNVESSETSEIKLTKAVAMDCEMVGTGPTGEDSIIARVSIVNAYGDCLYDEFVKPKERVTDYRTAISGVRPSDLKKGKDLFEVQKDVSNIIEGRILVGHSVKHDLDVLFLSHPKHLIRDTAYYKPFREFSDGKTPSLKKLTSKILGCDIQSGEHSSIEDAQAAMLLYLRQKKEWEQEVRLRRRRKPKVNSKD